MARKIFITYKYGDTAVKSLNLLYKTRVRDYVDILQDHLSEDHLNKGELDGEDLSDFEDETIASKLRDKIYDSSLTIVLISKNMKEVIGKEKDQWMPWEISYSLKEHTRDGRTSLTNAILAVVIPDEDEKYHYFFNYDSYCNCTNYSFACIFEILKKNMFNLKSPVTRDCNGKVIFEGNYSYIQSIRWEDFLNDPNKYINLAYKIQENIEDYNITKTLK